MAEMTDKQRENVNTFKNLLISSIKRSVNRSEKVKNYLPQEIWASITYLDIFSSYLQEQKFSTISEAWAFISDIRIEKVYYVNNYLDRLEESIEANAKKK